MFTGFADSAVLALSPTH